MATDQFRRQLRREAEWWRSDGIISPEQYERLMQHYQFESLEKGARDRFIVILMGMGSLLLGLGVITFVAANWQAVTREMRFLLLLVLFFVVNILGYYLWSRPLPAHHPKRWQNRLGHGLLLLGGMVLGANLALGGQLFHISGTAAGLCLTWGFGVLLMAYGLRLTSLGVMAIALMGLGYWWGLQELAQNGVLPGFGNLLPYMPLITGALFLPLAYWCRSKALFGLGAIAILSSLEVVLFDIAQLYEKQGGWVVMLICALPPAFLWSYDDTIWRRLLRQRRSLTHPFRTTAQGLALVFLIVFTYLFSFRFAWFDTAPLIPFPEQVAHLFGAGSLLLTNPNLLVLVPLTILGWVGLGHPHRTGRWGLVKTDAVVLAMIATIALLTFLHWSVFPIQIVATYLCNVMFFLLGVGFLRQGLGQANRQLFWVGLVMLSMQIISRTLEYETGLLLKSFILILCGIGIIFFGLWFERYVRSLNPAPSPALPGRNS